jgi:hypothetical protein
MLDDGNIRIWILSGIFDYLIRILEAQKLTDPPMDPDP